MAGALRTASLPLSDCDLDNEGPRLPSLRHIAVGWGFNGASLRNALSNSQHSLVSLEVRVTVAVTLQS